jgi:hypothetical protein
MIQGVVGSDVRVRAAWGSCRCSRAAQWVVMFWGGELTLSGMRSLEASMKFTRTPRKMSVPGEISIRTGEITAKTGNRGLADLYHFLDITF